LRQHLRGDDRPGVAASAGRQRRDLCRRGSHRRPRLQEQQREARAQA
jgi:hypothetical protein